MPNGYLVGWAILTLGEIITPVMPELGTVTQMGALGVLAWVAWTQRQEIQQLRERHANAIDVLCNRWNAWETVRHADSEQLHLTLRDMTRQCAETQAKMGGS